MEFEIMQKKPQFFHVETYPRVASSLSSKLYNNSVDDIVREAIRDSAYSSHVPAPTEARLIAGNLLEELPQRLEALLENNLQTYTDKKGRLRTRLVRRDEHVLLVAVYTYGQEKDLVDDKAMKKFFNACIAFHEKQFGEVDSAVQHNDEAYFHIHVYTISVNAKKLHPGHRANESRKHDKKSATSYRQAMSVLQDQFHEEVAMHFDMPRYGTRRPRIIRSEYLRIKDEAEKQAAEFVEQQKQRSMKIEAEAEAKAQAAELRFMEQVDSMQSKLRNIVNEIQRQKAKLGSLESANKMIAALKEQLAKAEALNQEYQKDDDDFGPR